jgi:hypothetical protein
MRSEPAVVTHPIESPRSPPKTTVSVSPTPETSQLPSTGPSPLLPHLEHFLARSGHWLR